MLRERATIDEVYPVTLKGISEPAGAETRPKPTVSEWSWIGQNRTYHEAVVQDDLINRKKRACKLLLTGPLTCGTDSIQKAKEKRTSTWKANIKTYRAYLHRTASRRGCCGPQAHAGDEDCLLPRWGHSIVDDHWGGRDHCA